MFPYQRRRLIERLGLLFEQRQIMQRIVNEIGRLVAARVHGDRFIPADYLNPVDISLRQNLLVTIGDLRTAFIGCGDSWKLGWGPRDGASSSRYCG